MFDLVTLIKAAGYLGLFGIVFAETGLLFGFIFPGDSLLFTAGILASQGYLDIVPLTAILFLAVLAGDNTGYYLGRKFGPRIFKKDESLFFHKSYLERSQNFFQKHGPKTLILARFIPIVRTFAPTLAGVGQMSYFTFLLFSVIGASLWAIGLTLLGYFLGQKIPNIELYIIPGIIIIVFASISPYLYKFFTDKDLRLQIYQEIGKLIRK
jgi:membrane-associated protein